MLREIRDSVLFERSIHKILISNVERKLLAIVSDAIILWIVARSLDDVVEKADLLCQEFAELLKLKCLRFVLRNVG